MRGRSTAFAVVLVSLSLLPFALPASAAPKGHAPAPFAVPQSVQEWMSARQGAQSHAVPTRGEARADYVARHTSASTPPFARHGLEVHAPHDVVAGTPVAAGLEPKAMVRLAGPNDELGFCSGTAITPFLILTAAHCAEVAQYTTVSVLAGSRIIGGSGQSVRYAAVGAVIDPQWDSATADHDVGVIVLAKPFQGPLASVATPDTIVANGTALQLFGWGLTGPWTATPLRLQQATVHALANPACDAVNAPLLEDPNATVTTDAMMCTRDGVHGGCFGDSGGPLFLGTGPGRIQVGVVSWGAGDCDPAFATVYARLSALHAFLDPLLISAPVRVDVKAPWMDWGAVAIGPADTPLDVCGFSLHWTFGFCGAGTPILVSGGSITLLPTWRGPLATSLEAVGPSGTISTVAAGLPSLATFSVASVALTPKPTVAVVRVAPDATFPVTLVADASGGCVLDQPYAEVDCDWASDLFGLAYPYVGSAAPVASLTAWGTAFGGPWPATAATTATVATKLGAIGALTPRFTLAPGAAILAPKLGKGALTDLNLWLPGASEPGAQCTYFPTWSPFTSCDGDLAGGLLGGRLVVRSSDGPFDLEALQYLQLFNGPTSSAVAEGIATPPGATVAVPLVFGAPAKLA